MKILQRLIIILLLLIVVLAETQIVQHNLEAPPASAPDYKSPEAGSFPPPPPPTSSPPPPPPTPSPPPPPPTPSPPQSPPPPPNSGHSSNSSSSSNTTQAPTPEPPSPANDNDDNGDYGNANSSPHGGDARQRFHNFTKHKLKLAIVSICGVGFIILSLAFVWALLDACWKSVKAGCIRKPRSGSESEQDCDADSTISELERSGDLGRTGLLRFSTNGRSAPI